MTQRKWPSSPRRRTRLFSMAWGLILVIASIAGITRTAASAAEQSPAMKGRPVGFVGQGLPSTMSSTTRLGLEPSSLALSTGQAATVQVRIYDVVNLYGFELHMGFNPAVIRIVDQDPSRPGVNTSLGDFLFPDYVAVNSCDNVAGKINVSALQVGRAPRSGSGCLITLTLEAIGPGDAALVFLPETKLSDSNAFMIPYTALPFSLTASGPTLTPSPSATPTPTPSATRTAAPPSPSATATPTRTATATPPGPTAIPTPYYYLDPLVLSLSPNDTGQVVIRTSYVDNLCGVQVRLRWDPTLLEVVDADPATEGVQVAPGDLFVGRNVLPFRRNEVDNSAGELEYVLALNEGFNCLSGHWSVATITLRALGEGVSSLTFFDAVMSNAHGEIPSGSIHGEVRIAWPSPTPTQTPPPTHTPTATPTATPTSTATSTATPTPTATLRPVGECVNLIENGSFEVQLNRQAPPWLLLDGAALGVGLGRGGGSCLWLGGYDGARDRAYQRVSLPADATSATLSYWWRMETQETSHPHDHLYVELLGDDGRSLATLDVRSDGDRQQVWQRSAFDLLPYAGQAILVQFRMQANATAFTSFFLDDVRLDVCTGEAQLPTPTPSPTGAYSLYVPIVLRN